MCSLRRLSSMSTGCRSARSTWTGGACTSAPMSATASSRGTPRSARDTRCSRRRSSPVPRPSSATWLPRPATSCSAPAALTSAMCTQRATGDSRGPAAMRSKESTGATPSLARAPTASPCIPPTCARRSPSWTPSCARRSRTDRRAPYDSTSSICCRAIRPSARRCSSTVS